MSQAIISLGQQQIIKLEQVLFDSVVFPDDKAAKEIANKVSSEGEALHIGVIAEKDSILFYYEMRNLVREPAATLLMP